MPEYVAALEHLTRSQEHISQSVGALAKSIVRNNEENEARSRARFTQVYRILAFMAIGGAFIAAFVVWKQQDQLNTLNMVVGNQQIQLDNQTRGIADRNRQFDQSRASDLCSQKLNAGFFGAIAAGLTAPIGSPERAAANIEVARLGEIYAHIDDTCFSATPATNPTQPGAPIAAPTTTGTVP